LAKNRLVYHDGTVVSFEGEKIRVKIISKSACADCHAKGACSAADMEEKYIDTIRPPMTQETFKEGDLVTVIMEQKLGRIALFYGFVLPFLVMVLVLFTLSGLGHSETKAGLLALSSLVPYYLLLFLFRKKVEKDFVFTLKKKT
jgi:sigma-E factor negative regulatory protein RseC